MNDAEVLLIKALVFAFSKYWEAKNEERRNMMKQLFKEYKKDKESH